VPVPIKQSAQRLTRRAAGAVRRVLPRPSARPSAAPSAAPVPAPPVDQDGEPRAPRTAILVVDGFDRRGRWGAFNEEEAREFPWVDLCLTQIERHSRSSDYEVLVWDNTWMPEHRDLIERHDRVRRFQARDEGRELRHGQSLDRLVKKVRPGTEFVITLDTDSFPVRDGWIENLTARLDDEVLVAGVWRDEMAPRKPAFIHPSCLAVRRSTLTDLGVGFAIGEGNDVAQTVTTAVLERGKRVSRLRRSNVWEPHFLMGAVYGDLIYHQGAGSRAPMFSQESDADHDETVRLALRDTAFSGRLDDLVDVLAGNCDPSVLPRVAALVEAPAQE
jgi:hypothetical protein